MKASVGDKIILLRHDEHGVLRDGEIVEVQQSDGSPPYYVHWSDADHYSLIYPGPDAKIVHYEHDS